LLRIPRLPAAITGLAFSPDGQSLAITTGSPWSLPSLPIVPQPQASQPTSNSAQKGQDWSRALVQARPGPLGWLVRLDRAQPEEVPQRIADKGITPLAPEERPAELRPSIAHGHLYLWDLQSGKMVYTSPAAPALGAVAF